MKPIIKYSGGKGKELPRIKEALPASFDTVVEPFAGGAAVAFGLETKAVISDIRELNINLYNVVGMDLQSYLDLQTRVDTTKTMDQLELKKLYYDCRDRINTFQFKKDVNGNLFDIEMAYAWIVVRQLCFSGMERSNSKGEFNVPFGWYKKFSCNLTDAHHDFLKTCTTKLCSFEETMAAAGSNDFVFLDPPYLDRQSAYGSDLDVTDLGLHQDLFDAFASCEGQCLLVHIDCPEYRELYKDFNVHVIDFKYSQNFKGRDSSKSKVQHLYITNY